MAPGVSSSLVESVDLYPTVASVAGLPPPPDLDGTDLTPIIRDPTAEVSKAAYSEYPRCPPTLSEPWSDTTSCVHTKRADFAVMGYSVRTVGWRYTAWLHWDSANLKGDFSRPLVGEELYPHAGDVGASMDAFENVNLANDATHAAVQAEMFALAVAHWNVTRAFRGLPAAPVPAQPENADMHRLQFEIWDQ